MSEDMKIKKASFSRIALGAVIIMLLIGFTGGCGNSGRFAVKAVNFNQIINEWVPFIGSKDAPVTVLLFSDFSCPYCAAVSGANEAFTAKMQQDEPGWEPPVQNILSDYTDSGKVRLAVLYFLGSTGGRPAQRVAWCLLEQKPELYWHFFPAVFHNQGDVDDPGKMRFLAGMLDGVDAAKLDACLASDKYESRFSEEEEKGRAIGVKETPVFIIGKSDGSDAATIVPGAHTYSTIKQLIDSRL